MERLTFGDCCSPFLAIFTVRQTAVNYGEGKETAVKAIKENRYMDDYLDGTRTEEALNRTHEVYDIILVKGDFYLTGWQSNSQKIRGRKEKTRSKHCRERE